MANKKTPFLDFYYRHIKTGRIGQHTSKYCDSGLCELLDGFDWYLLGPDEEEKLQLIADGYCATWWGSGLKLHDKNAPLAFTPLRQNMVLLMAAINGEL